MITLIKPVFEKHDITITKELANIIWNEHFTSIIGKAQVDYMLDKFQSEAAINEQIKQGFLYFLIKNENEYVGYMSILINDDELLLSKFYILSSARKKGYGKKSLKFIEQLALQRRINRITLTVNKDNTNTIKTYEKLGFKTVDSVVKDIGNGFVMDDFIMEKSCINNKKYL